MLCVNNAICVSVCVIRRYCKSVKKCENCENMLCVFVDGGWKTTQRLAAVRGCIRIPGGPLRPAEKLANPVQIMEGGFLIMDGVLAWHGCQPRRDSEEVPGPPKAQTDTHTDSGCRSQVLSVAYTHKPAQAKQAQ